MRTLKAVRSRVIGKIVLAATVILSCGATASAQKHGGTMRLYDWSNPPSASILEEATVSTVVPFMPVFSNDNGYHSTGAGNDLGLGRQQDQAHLQAA